MLSRLLRKLENSGRAHKRMIVIGHDVLAMAVALWAAFSTRLGDFYWPGNPLIIPAAMVSFGIGILGLYRLRIYHIVLRYFDMRAANRLFYGAAFAAMAWVLVVYFARVPIWETPVQGLVPRSVGFIYCGFLFLLLFMGRYVMALLLARAGAISGPAARVAAP